MNRKVAKVTLRTDGPTEVTFDDLHQWVIWQFPRKKDRGLCGAVHAPIAEQTWYPAVIGYLDRKILIHGHLDQLFSSPDEAADWLATSADSK